MQVREEVAVRRSSRIKGADVQGLGRGDGSSLVQREAVSDIAADPHYVCSFSLRVGLMVRSSSRYVGYSRTLLQAL
jgi:hypothetical protein